MFRYLHRPRHALAAGAAALALALAACGGGGGSSGTGTLQMSLTDAPACGYDNVFVTVSKVSVHQSSTAGDNDPGWVDIPLSGQAQQRIDLLDFQNGTLLPLGAAPLAAGKYTQMRLLLADNTGASAPVPNAVVPTGGTETPLKTPSGQQTGLKMNVNIDVGADQLADFVIDFNACKSVVKAGASGNYLLKPVLAVTPVFISGVRGAVDASIASGTTRVALETSDGTVVKSTTPKTIDDSFLLPVAPGTYNLVVTSKDHATAVVTGVVVTADTVTTVDKIAPPSSLAGNPLASTEGTIGGAVTITTNPPTTSIDATLRALQTLTLNGAPTIEVADTQADASLGTYSMTLPSVAPVVAPYTTGALTFAADGGVAGKYKVETTAAGFAPKLSPQQTLAAGANLTLNVPFP